MIEFAPDVAVFDPLRDFAIGDLNSDADMAATLNTISRIVRTGNPRRIPLILHHALTGKAGHAKAVGFERGGFGRNSSPPRLRAGLINIAPEKPDSNETLIVASGKSNNSQEFEPFGIRLDPETVTYRGTIHRYLRMARAGWGRQTADRSRPWNCR